MTLDLTLMKNLVISLESSLGIVEDKKWFYDQVEKVQNTLICGVLKKFEYVYAISINMIKRRLELESISSSEIDGMNVRDLFRVAGEKGLISVVEDWLKYRELRSATAVAYENEKRIELYEKVKIFFNDAVSLLQVLQRKQ